jgi:hypothetical protein
MEHSNDPGIEKFNTPALTVPRFSKSCGTPPGASKKEPLLFILPLITYKKAHRAFKNVKHIIFVVSMDPRTLCIGIQPPFRNRVLIGSFFIIRFKNGLYPPHVIGSTLPGFNNDLFSQNASLFFF